MSTATIKSVHSFLQEKDIKTSSGSFVRSYVHDHGSGVILCMVHGYPQSSYMWRHVAPLLKDTASLFIPELPGYGISSAPPSPSKKEIGAIILEALASALTDGDKRPIIWCSHDRGARVGHRVLVSQIAGSSNIVSAVFMDIVPTLEQWRAFSNPAAAVGYFHWPFLASPDAPAAILAMGGDHFCRAMLNRASGVSEVGKKKLQENDAFEHYCALFAKEDTIRGSCADYADGSVNESQEQSADQEAGRKVKVPVLVLYSETSLGRMHNVEAVWKPWVDADLECIGIGDGHGHYLPESAPDIVNQKVQDWIRRTAS